jgi:hypothetical protein
MTEQHPTQEPEKKKKHSKKIPIIAGTLALTAGVGALGVAYLGGGDSDARQARRSGKTVSKTALPAPSASSTKVTTTRLPNGAPNLCAVPALDAKVRSILGNNPNVICENTSSTQYPLRVVWSDKENSQGPAVVMTEYDDAPNNTDGGVTFGTLAEGSPNVYTQLEKGHGEAYKHDAGQVVADGYVWLGPDGDAGQQSVLDITVPFTPDSLVETRDLARLALERFVRP